MAETKVVFDDAGGYERYMGRWSRAIGEKFLTWIDAPKQAKWLDVGCGTGAFTELILSRCDPAKVTAVDPAPAQLEHAKKSVVSPKVEFRPATAVYLPFRIGEFDVVVSALVIQFIPNRPKGFSEMLRVTKPGGLIAGYTWERSETLNGAPYEPMARGLTSIGVEFAHSAMVPEAMPDGLKQSLVKGGYKNIEVTTIEATQTFRDFEDYWISQTPSFPATGRAIAALDDAGRETLRKLMRETLPTASDGTITYSARATAFKATKG